MAIFRGFVQSVNVRGDGRVEVVVEAVHASNATQSFFIRNLDGDLTQTNKRLAQLSLLRDGLARVLPMQVDYSTSVDEGDLVDDVTVFPRPSIDGRADTRQVSGVVAGVGITELGPLSGSSPYLDAPDVATIMLLTDAGAIQGYRLDLQRPDPLTAQAELRLLERAHRTRRPVVLVIATDRKNQGGDGGEQPRLAAAAATTGGQETIVSSQWATLPEADLNYVYAFVERLGQRYESYTSSSAPALSHVSVVYTTAPGQTPEGDISDDGSFAPALSTAWVHDDSPLLVRLEAALRDSLQVKLGLSADQIHAVDLVAHLGSAARPIWIVEDCRFIAEEGGGACVNVPTIQGPTGAAIGNIPRSVVWHGNGFFQEGVWRFVLGGASSTPRLKVDGHAICCEHGKEGTSPQHMYLKGMHCVDLEISGVTCSSELSILIYRIR